MIALVRSGKGRLHLATPAGAAWRAQCGSLIVRPQSIDQSCSPSALAPLDDACAYCRAIGYAVAFAEACAEQAVQDATLWGMRAARR